MISRISEKRFFLVRLLLWLIFPIILYQIFKLSVFNQKFLVDRAKLQQNVVIPIAPERGAIFSRTMRELASNLKTPSIYAVPRMMKKSERQALIPKLTQALGLEKKFLENRLSRDKSFVWLKRHASEQEAARVHELGNPNLGVTQEPRRHYPNGPMLAQVMGFCNIDNQGLEGLELLYEDKLKGRPGFRRTKRDAHGKEIVALEEKLVPAINGSSLVLTIDHYIQHVTDEALSKAYYQWNAAGAVAIVMNPHTGEILAMSNQPSFDPNEQIQGSKENRRNRTITDIYEPGSVFKVVTASAALNEGVASLESSFDCEQGEWRVNPSRVIHDVHPYGRLSFSEVLIKSSNIGTVKIAQKLGEEKLYEYIKKFGFGEPTGIDFPGEVGGILRPVSRWSKYSISSIPYGQEVAATAIQMVRAISLIANGGYLVRPYLLKEIRDAQGETIFKHEPVKTGPFLKPEVVAQMSQILERVVTEGTGTKAMIEGVRVAGKTGTTQKMDPKGGYSHNHFVSSFVGFAPAEKPLLVMIVSVDDPRPYYYGGTVAAPVFGEAIERSLLHMGYVPQGSLETKVSRVTMNRSSKSEKKSPRTESGN